MTILWDWSQSFQIWLWNLIAPLLSHVIRQSFTTTYKWLAMWFIKEFHIKISQLVFNIIIFVCIIYNFLSLIISAYSVWVLSPYTLNIHPEFTKIYNNLSNNFTKTLLLATSISSGGNGDNDHVKRYLRGHCSWRFTTNWRRNLQAFSKKVIHSVAWIVDNFFRI